LDQLTRSVIKSRGIAAMLTKLFSSADEFPRITSKIAVKMIMDFIVNSVKNSQSQNQSQNFVSDQPLPFPTKVVKDHATCVCIDVQN